MIVVLYIFIASPFSQAAHSIITTNPNPNLMEDVTTPPTKLPDRFFFVCLSFLSFARSCAYTECVVHRWRRQRIVYIVLEGRYRQAAQHSNQPILIYLSSCLIDSLLCLSFVLSFLFFVDPKKDGVLERNGKERNGFGKNAHTRTECHNNHKNEKTTRGRRPRIPVRHDSELPRRNGSQTCVKVSPFSDSLDPKPASSVTRGARPADPASTILLSSSHTPSGIHARVLAIQPHSLSIDR